MNNMLAALLVLTGLLTLTAAIVGGTLLAERAASALSRAYALLAQHYHGSAKPGDLFNNPSAQFRHRGALVDVTMHAAADRREQYFTQLRIEWPDPTLRCEIYPENIATRLGLFLGLNDIELGSPWFDKTFVIIGNDAAAIRELLSPAVQDVMAELFRCQQSSDLYLLISGGALLVKKRGILRQPEHLLGFVAKCLRLHDVAIQSQALGIDFAFERAEPASPTCLVCGSSIAQNVVNCQRCRTPHHADCWQYAGGCSVYGCGGKNSQAA